MATRILCAFLAVFLTSGCAVSRALRKPIPTSAADGIKDQRNEAIGEVIRKTMRAENIPGISVAVIDGGEIVWAQGFGWREISNGLVVGTNTQFQAGSISKSVTALAAVALASSGKLSLD